MRAYYRGFCRDLVTAVARVEDGHAWPPDASRLGMALREEVLSRPDVTVRRSG